MSNNSEVDLDALARKLMREHNRLLREWEKIGGTMGVGPFSGFMIAWPDRPTQHWSKDALSFPRDSYVLPILTVPTTARDVLLWLDGRLTGKHADRNLVA